MVDFKRMQKETTGIQDILYTHCFIIDALFNENTAYIS